MLTNLHVKIWPDRRSGSEFGPGLNILTGETGAGKSILIGSINAALERRYPANDPDGRDKRAGGTGL